MESATSPDGTSATWYSEGQGPPLLLVHGTTADHTRWNRITPRLAEQFTVHAMDRRGRGHSTDADAYEIQREAEDVAAVVDAIGGKVAVLGHSYGAICTLEASLLTDGIEKMILYEPPIPTGLPMYPPGLPDRMQPLIDEGALESALVMFFREVVRMPEEELEVYRQLPVWPRRIELAPTIPREMASTEAYDFEPERFAGLATPALLLLGGDSPTMFQQAVEVLWGALPNSTVTVLAGQQHIAMDTDPELFLDKALDYLAS